MLKLRFMIAIIVFSLLSAKAAVMPTSAIVNSPSADELSAARRLMTSATQLPSTGNPPSTISPTVKLTSRSSNVSPSYDKNHPSSLFPSPYDSYGSSSPPSSANPSNTYPSSLLAPSSACPSTGSSSFPSGVLPSSYSSSPLSQNIVPASINPTLLTASSSICPTTTSKRYPSSLFPSSYGGYSSRSSSPTVNPSSSEDAASLIPTSLPPSSYSSYTGVSSPYPSASPAPTLTSYPSSPTSLVPSTINLQTFRPTGYPSYEQTLISTSPYGCPSSANGFVPSSAPSTPSTRIGSTYPHGNFFPDSSSMPTIETDTSLLRSTVMHFCKANGYWDAVYGIQSGYIIWLAALTIMWSALACLSFALVSFGSINSLELMIIVSTDISFSLLRIFLIISITKNIGAGRFSCVELIFMHPFVNHEPNPLETLLLAAEGIVLACNLLLVPHSVNNSTPGFYFGLHRNIIKAMVLIYLLQVVNFSVYSTFFSESFTSLQFLIRYGQVTFGMVIFLLPLIYGLTFKISTQIGMRCCSCLIAWPAASSLGIAYVISFPESIYQNAELAFVVFSIAVRILEVVFAFFMVISLPKRKRPVRSSNSSLSLCTDSDEITDNHYLLPELCSSSKHAFAPAKHKLQLNIPKNSNSEERLDRITRARLDQARIQPSDGRINFYAPLSKFNMAPLSSASIIRTPSNPRRNLSASLFQLGGSYREPESTRSELGYFPEDEFSHDVRRMNR